MSKVTVKIATTSVALPTGRTPGKLRISLLQGGEVLDFEEVTGKEAVFERIDDGQYTVTAQRLDSSGAELGGVITANFTVDGNVEQMYDAPSAITVDVTAD